jgi:ubiquinone/menaquinone biosynthesis C-methylase UbiE
MTENNQRNVFLNGEGDEWHSRNLAHELNELDHIDPVIHQSLGSCTSVLEIGCADGRRLARISEKCEHISTLVGIDPSSAAITAGSARFTGLDLRVGTADSLPKGELFDAVVIGFCLYLCDRELLSKIVSEVDRVLADGGVLVLVDFDPPHPRRRRYHHHEGIWSYKMNYSELFTALPHFVLSSKTSISHSGNEWEVDERERIAVWSIRKNLSGGYSEEQDS